MREVTKFMTKMREVQPKCSEGTGQLTPLLASTLFVLNFSTFDC